MKLHYPKQLWTLAFCGFLNFASQFLIVPLTTLYVHTELEKPLAAAGVILLLHSAGGSLGQVAGGALFDRIGARPVLLLSFLVSAALLAIPAATSNWLLYALVMSLFGFSSSLAMPALNASAAKAWPEGGVRTFNFLYVANNLGIAAGTAVGGWVAQVSFPLGFGIGSGTLVVLALFAAVQFRPAQAAESLSAKEAAAAAEQADGKIPWSPVLALALGTVLLWIAYVQWQTNVSVRMQDQGFTLSQYSLLWTANGLLIFLAQPLLAAAVRKLRSPVSQMCAGTVLFLASYALLYGAGSYAWYLAGMTVLTFGEMLLWPVIPAVVSVLSPPARQGFLQGFIGLAGTTGRMAGPLLGALAYDALPFKWFALAMMGLLLVPLLGLAGWSWFSRQARSTASLS